MCIRDRNKRETRDLCIVRCVKDEDQKVLVRDEEIKMESMLTDYSMVVLLKIWVTLPFSARIYAQN